MLKAKNVNGSLPLFPIGPRAHTVHRPMNPVASDAVAWRQRIVERQKTAQPSLVQHLELPEPSARFHRKNKDLAGINTIWISNMVPVRFVNDCVLHACAVGDTADAPEAVARGYDRGRHLRRDYGGG